MGSKHLPVLDDAYLRGDALLTSEVIEVSKPAFEFIPYPVLWIATDSRVVWMNRASKSYYGSAEGKCHEVSHGYDTPCDNHGEPCPKARSEDTGKHYSVNHVHTTASGLQLFKVTAIPIEQGGVLEFHVPLEDVMGRDSLTGCYTRKFFEQMIDRQLALLRRMGGSQYGVAMLDLDHFKKVNDEHGHATGDEALRKVGEAIRESIRESDVVGRWGGEEFCLFLPGTGMADAVTITDRVQDAIRSIELSVGIQITASLGFSTGPASSVFKQLIEKADKALYMAKSDGRNRVRSF